LHSVATADDANLQLAEEVILQTKVCYFAFFRY